MADKLNYKVGMISALDMLRFKNMPKVREKAIQAASSAPLPKTLTTNEKAKAAPPGEAGGHRGRDTSERCRRKDDRPQDRGTAPPSRRSEPGNTSACASPSAGP